MAAAPREHLEQHHRPARVLPRQDRDAAQAQRRRWSSGTTARCRARLDDLVTLPGVGRKTANVVLGNAFGVPGHHRRHPLRPAGPPARLDRGDRPGQGRARDRRAVPQARLDDAQPPPDLARPPRLPRQEARLRRLPGRALVPVVRRGPDRPGRRRELVKTEGRREAARLVARCCAAAGRAARGLRRTPSAQPPGPGARSTSTPRAARSQGRQAGVAGLRARRRPAASRAGCPT